ncbi:LuxR family transcriptional regulator [Nostoc linckia z18]|uniref:LuxR family transcriptional regulator n=2 Tax=Nostoc linckia TaxID=92942 RepID=A0A9Q6EL60_NOSLI|nr:response regulator transcription factor [Nostoc linckia]PHK41372.1 LuxR family transcriptional regulator [Nostoc linckia z15]PHK45908.1 LuxR family transcriptional regulator [Nostoc linckia z16]PHJ60860.1 LuxR family transcriptional regulator [Nostoc linckia z3]PHJ67243.1 LuxR family transcriptional regulator [Nostoc linckia z1]PHJ76723.1 LuxR family transcriptional regulator [Nostoc linckia z2]
MVDIRVAIIEDHSLTRIGMRSSLNEQEGIQVVGDEATASNGLKLLQSTKPDIAIVDIGLPDRDGIWLVQQFRESLMSETAAQTKVMMLTSFAKEQMVLAAFAAGADSYCVKTIKFELLLEALHITHEGQSWIDPAIARIVLKHTRQGTVAVVKPNATQTVTISAIDPEQASILQADPLTNRELQVLELIVQGYSNNEIAQKLYLSLGSVKVYVRGVLNKLCASDRTQAAVLALRAGLLN